MVAPSNSYVKFITRIYFPGIQVK